MPISLAVAKYGKESFEIESVAGARDQGELDDLEVLFVEFFRTWSPSGYNLRAGKARGKTSRQTRRRIGDALRGRRLSAEHRRNLSEAHKGSKLSEDRRRALSRLYRGRRLPPSAYANSIAACEKTYSLIDPLGALLTVTNMAKFCREHRLSKSKMCDLAKGRRASYRGYRADNAGKVRHT